MPAGRRNLKVILGTGRSPDAAQRARRRSGPAMMAGADFIKTSTGKESGQRNAFPSAGHDAADPRNTKKGNGGSIQAGRRDSDGGSQSARNGSAFWRRKSLATPAERGSCFRFGVLAACSAGY